MIDFYSLHVPDSSTPGQCLATFSTAITALAIELGTYFNNQMRAKFSDHWFADLKEDREQFDSKYKQYKSFYDFSWIVNEAYHYPDSEIRKLLPKNEYQFYPTLLSLLSIRNQWYHHFSSHNLQELRKALASIKYIADKCNLELADDLVPIIQRVRDISSGVFVPEIIVATQPGEAAGVKEDSKSDSMSQIAVGAAWMGPLGSRKIELRKTGSLIDLEEGRNVTGELVNSQKNQYLKLWRSLELDWLWVDPRGSVAAYVHGSLRMVGYWGKSADEANQDPFAKFLLENTYTYAGDDFFDRENNRALSLHGVGPITKSTIERGRKMVKDGEVIRITWDGDMIYFGDQGPEYIGEVESKDWFPGHFLVPTSEPD